MDLDGDKKKNMNVGRYLRASDDQQRKEDRMTEGPLENDGLWTDIRECGYII